MGKIIPFQNKEKDKESQLLNQIGLDYDSISIKYLENDTDIRKVTAVMANRVGELIRVFKGPETKEEMLDMVIRILIDRMYKNIEQK